MHNVFEEKGYIQIKVKNKINCCFNPWNLSSLGDNYNRMKQKEEREGPKWSRIPIEPVLKQASLMHLNRIIALHTADAYKSES